MKTSLSKSLAFFAAATIVLAPALAFAQTPPAPGAPTTGATPTAAKGYSDPTVCDPATGVTCLKDTFDQGPQSVILLIKKITNWFFTFLLVIAVLFFVYAAYNYLLSEGNEEKVSTAHKMVIYGSVAVAVGALAQGIVYVVQKLTGNQ